MLAMHIRRTDEYASWFIDDNNYFSPFSSIAIWSIDALLLAFEFEIGLDLVLLVFVVEELVMDALSFPFPFPSVLLRFAIDLYIL